MTGLLLLAAPIGIAVAVAFWAAWSEVSSLIRWQRSQHPTPQLCDRCNKLAARHNGLCIDCHSKQPVGVLEDCLTPGCTGTPMWAHPDGGAGGVCTDCVTRLLK